MTPPLVAFLQHRNLTTLLSQNRKFTRNIIYLIKNQQYLDVAFESALPPDNSAHVTTTNNMLFLLII